MATNKQLAITEKQLDHDIEKAFKESPAFARWFLDRTKFRGRNGVDRHSRSDNPWSRQRHTVDDETTGEPKEVIRDSETDILVIFEDVDDHTHFAIHVENKLGHGHFTWMQPEFYHQRAQHWAGNPKFLGYTDYTVVLIAPREFHNRCQSECAKFDMYVPHEEIAEFIPSFRPPMAAIT